MRGYRFVLIWVMIIASGSLRSQTIERSVISPFGGSATVGPARVAWNAGEIATEHLSNGGTGLTQGFEQPYIPLGLITAENFSGNPGENRRMNITLAMPAGLYAAAASAIHLKLRFNATLLEPVETIPAGLVEHDTIANGRRTLDLLLPLQLLAPPPLLLGTLNFTVGLGNDSLSAMELLEARPVGGRLLLRTIPGNFTLLGICRQGGPRLVNPIERAHLSFRPNPAASQAAIELDLMQQGDARVRLVDFLGRTRITVLDQPMQPGHYTFSFNVESLPSGPYAVVLETASRTASYQLIVQH